MPATACCQVSSTVVCSFRFQASKKLLGQRIIQAIARPTHAYLNTKSL